MPDHDIQSCVDTLIEKVHALKEIYLHNRFLHKLPDLAHTIYLTQAEILTQQRHLKQLLQRRRMSLESVHHDVTTVLSVNKVIATNIRRRMKIIQLLVN